MKTFFNLRLSKGRIAVPSDRKEKVESSLQRCRGRNHVKHFNGLNSNEKQLYYVLKDILIITQTPSVSFSEENNREPIHDRYEAIHNLEPLHNREPIHGTSLPAYLLAAHLSIEHRILSITSHFANGALTNNK